MTDASTGLGDPGSIEWSDGLRQVLEQDANDPNAVGILWAQLTRDHPLLANHLLKAARQARESGMNPEEAALMGVTTFLGYMSITKGQQGAGADAFLAKLSSDRPPESPPTAA